MNFVSEVFKFYQTDSLSILIYSQVVMIIFPIIFLAMSLIDNLRLTHKKIEDKPSRRAYHLKRLLYLMAYIACNVIANLVIYPVMCADVELPTNLVVDVLLIATYLYASHCLMQLEAGTALLMHLAICLPIMYVFDKYLNAGAASVGLVAAMGWLYLVYWSKCGNSLARKYFRINSVWDLKCDEPENH